MLVVAKESLSCRVIGLWAKPTTKKPAEAVVSQQPQHSAEQGEPRLPAELSETLNEFSTRLGVHPTALLGPVFTVAGVPLGNTVLETDLFPVPINACLECLIVEDNDPEVERLVQALVQPLRDEQDQRISAAGHRRSRQIRAEVRALENERESFFAGALKRNHAAAASFDLKIKSLQDQLQPLLVSDNHALGSLHLAVALSDGLLANYDPATFQSTIKARKKGAADLELIAHGWQNRTPAAGLVDLSGKIVAVRPAVSCLARCDERILASLACANEPAIRHFADRLIVVDLHNATMALGSGSVPKCWRTLLKRLMASRRPHQPRCFRLSKAAAELLAEYAVRNRRDGGQGLSKYATILVCKLALILHVMAGTGTEVSLCTMGAALEASAWILNESTTALNRCVAAAQLTEMECEADQMLKKIQILSPVSVRELQRTYRRIKVEELRRILDQLVAAGQVRLRTDGLIEAVAASQADAPKG